MKGKGGARVVTDKAKAVAYAAKILAKYVKKEHLMIKATLDALRKGRNVMIEITPAYFSSWDYAKLRRGKRNGLETP